MRIHYPKSFFKLLSVGFLLAVLPLVIGLLTNTVAIQRLADKSQRAVYDAARVAHATRELSEAASALERAAQQSTILHDDALWASYLALHRRFLEAGAQLGGLPLEAPLRAALNGLLQQEAALHAELLALGVRDEKSALAARRHAEITDAARRLLGQSNGAIDLEVENLRALAADTESRVKMQLFLLLPFALIVVAGFTYLLARPIAQLEQGIRDLGERRLDAPIVVAGPGDLEQLGRQLDWLRLRLVQLEEQKSRFLRHVSHELKTPLTAVREGSDLLAEEVAGPLSERQREIVRILRQHGLDLQRLIEALLRHGEAEFRQTPLKLQPLRPREIIDQVTARQALALAAREAHIALDVEDFVMRGDAERLRVVFDNLLSNAIKHSPAGGTITISAAQRDSQAVFSVRDQGPGIAEADREFLFDPFYRGETSPPGTVKSSGLGLSIAHEHVLALGGRIDVASGPGACFMVYLPLDL